MRSNGKFRKGLASCSKKTARMCGAWRLCPSRPAATVRPADRGGRRDRYFSAGIGVLRASGR
ncbi:hypothetical protein HMPREF0043_00107 [Actinobaculum sp. oral taxon 183 str. F0552]|nr:hypothetical protein HMPREF0043_00107 [Actinobaculum sp. oral taxon 183 str. F0552]